MCERKADTVGEDQRMARQWIVSVDGNDLKVLHNGESVEIGRKPLRPLPEDGFSRLDIQDPNKSMSKRHAVFSVDEQGNGSIRDLHSTNGSFVVTDGGQLMRLPVDEAIPLHSTSVTLQFGDVRLRFEAGREDTKDDSASDDANGAHEAVSNLFEYAVSDDIPQEPDAADMSVDDILNLRAGEPTAFFHARNITDRAVAMRQAERQEFTPAQDDKPQSVDDFPSVSLVQENAPIEDKPRDLFADAAAQAAAAESASAEDANKNEGKSPALPDNVSSNNAEHDTIPVDRLFGARPKTPVAVALPTRPDTDGEERKPDESAEDQSRAPETKPSDDAARQAAAQSQEPANAVPAEATETRPDDDERFRPQVARSQPAPDETTAFKPIFEPGSVFDRVSKGGLAKQEQTIEVDGLTSDDAKHTDDFTVQFQMARHPELLPFLAMNPSLYDDLYAWLGALGNQDIDAALSHNPGYEEYRKAVGK
ncbi:FHA domain-containing protein [Bifidobacterium ruminantium]|nr:FHA domain-containing protein [Bifidobacterium ruminantium]